MDPVNTNEDDTINPPIISGALCPSSKYKHLYVSTHRMVLNERKWTSLGFVVNMFVKSTHGLVVWTCLSTRQIHHPYTIDFHV